MDFKMFDFFSKKNVVFKNCFLENIGIFALFGARHKGKSPKPYVNRVFPPNLFRDPKTHQVPRGDSVGVGSPYLDTIQVLK